MSILSPRNQRSAKNRALLLLVIIRNHNNGRVYVISDLPQRVLVGAVDAEGRHGSRVYRRRTVSVDERLRLLMLLDGAPSGHEPQQRAARTVDGRRARQ